MQVSNIADKFEKLATRPSNTEKTSLFATKIFLQGLTSHSLARLVSFRGGGGANVS